MGFPIVSTAIENLEDLGNAIFVASSPGKFVEAIEKALRQSTMLRETGANSGRDQYSWERRVDVIMDLIEKHLPPTLSYHALSGADERPFVTT